MERIVSEMTYTVSSGTLNSSIPYHTIDGKEFAFSLSDHGPVGCQFSRAV